jgi:hypothetical protein
MKLKIVFVFCSIFVFSSFIFFSLNQFFFDFSLNKPLLIRKLDVFPPCSQVRQQVLDSLSVLLVLLEEAPLLSVHQDLKKEILSHPFVRKAQLRIDFSGYLDVTLERKQERLLFSLEKAAILESGELVTEVACGDSLWGHIDDSLMRPPEEAVGDLLRFLENQSKWQNEKNLFLYEEERWLVRDSSWTPGVWGDLLLSSNKAFSLSFKAFFNQPRDPATFYLSSGGLYVIPRSLEH